MSAVILIFLASALIALATVIGAEGARALIDRTPPERAGRPSYVVSSGIVTATALLFLLFEKTWQLDQRVTAFAAWVFAGLAIAYFAYVILYTLYLSAKDANFDENAVRLARNTALSVLMSVATFALLYASLGLDPPECGPDLRLALPGPIDLSASWSKCPAPRAIDHIYFSMVTFSTLGFGDFTPGPDARIVAGLHAILGNLHLGIFVGIALIAIKGRD